MLTSVVFTGGWGPRRRRGPFGPGYGPGYGPPYGPYGPTDEFGRPLPMGGPYPPGYYRRGGGGSCLRDLFFVEAGCCLADALGCGPQLLLVAPAAIRRGLTSGPAAAPDAPPRGRAARAALAVIDAYQREISPRRPDCCHFTPTCSHYAADAIRAHGFGRGARLAVGRLLRCRPGAAGGVDPVPRPARG